MSAVTKRGAPRQRVARGASIEERILLHTDRSGGCWIWTAAIDNRRYGRLQYEGRLERAHRLSYIAFVGPIPDGYQIDHLCRVTTCCNPAHLEAVTPQVNMLRSDAPGAKARRRDVCLYGHPYDEFGAMAQGRRICMFCRRQYARLYREIPYVEVMRRKREGIPVVDLAAHFGVERVA